MRKKTMQTSEGLYSFVELGDQDGGTAARSRRLQAAYNRYVEDTSFRSQK